jgi:hypothetical protein
LTNIQIISIVVYSVSIAAAIIFFRNRKNTLVELIILYLTGWLNPKKMAETFDGPGIVLVYVSYASLFIYILS